MKWYWFKIFLLSLSFYQLGLNAQLVQSDVTNNEKYTRKTITTNNAYYLFPSAYNLEKNEVQIKNKWIFLNSIKYGISDQLSIEGGFEFLSLLVPEFDTPLMYGSLKYTLLVDDNVSLGIVASLTRIPYDFFGLTSFSGGLNVMGLQPVVTLGNPDYHLSIGYNMNKVLGSFGSDFEGLFNLSAAVRLHDRIDLMTEVFSPAIDLMLLQNIMARLKGDKWMVEAGIIAVHLFEPFQNVLPMIGAGLRI